MPLPSGASSGSLTAISCTADGVCIAVGESTSAAGEQPLVERWAGGHWTPTPLSLPPGGMHGHLTAVSCPASGSCAIGGYDTAGGANLLQENLAGASWTASRLPGTADTVLQGVSCPTATDCVAVGSNGADTASIIKVWNGTGWTSAAVPPIPGGTAPPPSIPRSSAVTRTPPPTTSERSWAGA